MESRSYPVGLVGESHRQAAIGRCEVGDEATLKRQPANPYDSRAIIALNKHGEAIGYIGRDSFIQRLVHDEGGGCRATIQSLNNSDNGMVGVILSVEICDEPLDECDYP